MENINSIIISGRLTRDSEVTQTQNGGYLIKFAIANELYIGKAENYVNYFEIVKFAKSPKISEYLKKGQSVTIKGDLRQERWENEKGKQSKCVVYADKIELNGSRASGEQKQVEDKFGGTTLAGSDRAFLDEDIPF